MLLSAAYLRTLMYYLNLASSIERNEKKNHDMK